ncbi:DUF488 family protein [Dyadobacter sp. CY347]|uniref:DUF488 family protein, N3 subclade n=1 Tax=Dyadobacter sp. CY347 TaxID=2909336 RepID=UPI001F266BDA|nr:DUF488 family protein [Dyadobacter sp. CY347]MCF2487776.1 DUF488 family protein [Dyadobacter sp. CY347]
MSKVLLGRHHLYRKVPLGKDHLNGLVKRTGFAYTCQPFVAQGIKESEGGVVLWLREITPTAELKKWFNQELERWVEFIEAYNFQLNKKGRLLFKIYQVNCPYFLL